MRRRLLITFALGAVILAALLIAPNAAAAQTTEDGVYHVLAHFNSPLADESYTVVAFWRAHQATFDMADFYSILWAESSLGKGAMGHHNVGSIKGGPKGTLWRDLRIGTTASGYNRYGSFRDGQRAAIRLIEERYGGSLLRGGGLLRWYGAGVPGWSGYAANVAAAHRYLVAEAARQGMDWR